MAESLPAVLGEGGAGNKVADLSLAIGRPAHAALVLLAGARGQLLPWGAALVGAAVGLWFALPSEPGAASYLIAALTLALSACACAWGADLSRPLWIGLACLCLGWLACGLRLWVVQAPMLDFRYHGPVMGRVVEIDRSQSDALRITLDQVQLDRTSPARTPERVRLSLRARLPGHDPAPGQVVMATAHLSAPEGPVEPGAFDFRRMAFFDRLGAVGYTTAPLMLWEEAAPGARPVDRLRSYLSAAMLAEMPSQAGAFATASMTGDRSAITAETTAALRDSSLAHLLAISGMNLAFLIAFVFGLIRYGLALIPPVALRVNTKKVAAVVSLGVAGFYLALSGANVATERAFIMVSVMLCAILLDRKALTLRSVAIAGIIILLWKPESLLEPGFQMSFAATIALIAGFREVDRRVLAQAWPWWSLPLFTLVLSCVIGGFATAPYAAAHFNRFTDYGLIANLLTVPVMGAVVMPAGAMAALMAPIGLAALPLWVMEQGAAWILFVAHWVAGWDGAVTGIVAPPAGVLPLVTLAGLFGVMLTGRWRMLALPPLCAALALWATAPRPLLLISDDGALVGLTGPEGRALSAPRGAGFEAKNWLENDGDLAPQAEASVRTGMVGEEGFRLFAAAGVNGVALKGRGAEARLQEACALADLVIIPARVESPPSGCIVLDQALLLQTGTLALYPTEGGLVAYPTRGGGRAWSAPGVDAALWPRLIAGSGVNRSGSAPQGAPAP